jgi:agmatinase
MARLHDCGADVIFVGVPYDGGALQHAGARVGPGQLRAASRACFAYTEDARTGTPLGAINLATRNVALRGVRMADAGDLPIEPDADPRIVSAEVADTVRRIVACGARPVVLGGDHSISLGVVQGLDAHAPLGVLHFDAHPDFTLDESLPLTHATWVSHARRLAHFVYLAQFGPRGWYPVPLALASVDDAATCREAESILRSSGVDRLVTADAIADQGVECALDGLPDGLNWHVTLDIDVIDPAESRGTPAMVAMGLTSREVRRLLVSAAARLNIVAIDVVEVADGLIDRGAAASLGAWLLTELLDAVCRAERARVR